MTPVDHDPVIIARMGEMLRQEQETFDQNRRHQDNWFKLRLWVGATAIPLLFGIAIFCGFIMVRHESFPSSVVVSAGTALLVDTLGLVIAIIKVVIDPKSVAKLTPVTKVNLSANAALASSLQTRTAADVQTQQGDN